MTIDFCNEYNLSIINFDGIPHMMWKTDNFIGLQTWKFQDRYCIEMTLDGGVIETHYDSIEKFKTVLNLIKGSLL